MESTFLFTDLVGFTALTAERGDHHAADVALAFHVVRALLPAHVAERIVDGVGVVRPFSCPSMELST